MRFLFLVVLAVVVFSFSLPMFAASASKSIATIDLSTHPEAQLDKGAWSDVADEGGVKFRKALGGRFGTVKFKAWWKEGELRPPEGDTFILEVNYKDVLSSPAMVHARGGVGWNFEIMRLHAFGGAKDDQWKTAFIPLPWDMIARQISTLDPNRNTPDLAAIAITAPADVPVASIQIRKAVPEDEPRFYAETRAFIAAEQAGARAKNPITAVKDPPALKDALAAFPWDAGCRLFPCSPVPVAGIGTAVKVRMCLNELEPGSFGVYANGKILTGVDYEITPLKTADGKILKAAIERRTAEYAILDNVWSPVRLWQAYAVDIQPNRSHWFYFNVETKRGETEAGKYAGKILIKSKEGMTELPLEVEVLPVDLLTMDEAGVTMFGCYDDLPPLHDIAFEHRYNYGGALVWYGQFTMPMAMTDGKLAFDFTYPDDWMKGAKKRGFSGAIWYLGGDSAGMPGTLKIFSQLGGMSGTIPGGDWGKAQGGKPFVIPEVRKVFVDWMRQINTHAVSSGWLELFPTPHDEPQKWASKGEWIKGFFKDACAAIHEADPRIRVYGCIHHVKGWHGIPDLWKIFIDDLDVYNTNAIGEDPDVGNKVRAAGKESLQKGGKDKLFWQYTGLGGGVPENQRYTFGFYFGAFGSSGCTAWAYNWNAGWDLSGRGGDLAVTAWPTVYQTIPSPWFEGQREGLDDRRIIATYQKRFAKDAEALKALDAIFDEVKTSRSAKKSGENKEFNFFDSVDDAAKLVRWRNVLLDRLAAGGGK